MSTQFDGRAARDLAHKAVRNAWQDVTLTRPTAMGNSVNQIAIDRWFDVTEAMRICYESNITAQGAQWDNRRGKVS